MMQPETHSLIFRSIAQLDAFHAYERDRLLGKATGDGDRPAGLRLSIECPVKRLKANYDPSFLPPVAEGPADRGHEMESRYRAVMLDGIPHTHQPEIQWGPVAGPVLGRSAWDVIVPEDSRILEFKSTIGSQKPTPTHRRQVERMGVGTWGAAAEGRSIELWMIDPGNMTTTGPFLHTIEREAVLGLLAEYEALVEMRERLDTGRGAQDDVWDDTAAWEALGLACTCGSCFPREHFDAHGVIENRITHRDILKQQRDEADAELKTIDALLKDAAAEYAARKGVPPEDPITLRAHQRDYDIARNKNGVWAIRKANRGGDAA